MKIATILFLIVYTNLIYSQKNVDYNSKLNFYEGISIIDGAQIDNQNKFANIETDFIVFSNKSALTLVNCIIKVNGKVDASKLCKIRFINAYIICKSYNGPKSKSIIQTKNIDYAPVNDIVYIQRIKGNPILEIIDRHGKIIIKGTKKSIANKIKNRIRNW